MLYNICYENKNQFSNIFCPNGKQINIFSNFIKFLTLCLLQWISSFGNKNTFELNDEKVLQKH